MKSEQSKEGEEEKHKWMHKLPKFPLRYFSISDNNRSKGSQRIKNMDANAEMLWHQHFFP